MFLVALKLLFSIHFHNCFFANRDVALYALGIGACGTNAVDANELKYVYHNDGQQFIKV